MSRLELHFDYELPKKVIHEWWTDLSGTGYVGVNLKSLKPIGRKGDKILVETKWKIVGMDMTLLEKLSIISEDHWIWEPHMMGIDIVDDFRLIDTGDGRVRLTITSVMKPAGIKGKIVQVMIGRRLDRIMVDEWNSADRAFKEEMRSTGR